MDIEKLRPQVLAFGKMYRLLSDDTLSPQAVNLASMRPLRAYTERILKMQQARKITPRMEKELSELSEEINIDDWIDSIGAVIPLELQGIFLMGYNHGNDKTKLVTKRKAKKITQTQLADLIGATQKDVSRWEQGIVKPSTDTLIKLSQALECTVDELI